MKSKNHHFILFTVLVLFVSGGAAATEALTLLLNSPLIHDKPKHTTSSKVGVALVEQINLAKTHIDFALYGIRNQDEIYKALVNAKKRGVIIRGVIDKNIDDKNYYTSTPQLLAAFPDIITDYEADLLTAKKKKKQGQEVKI